MAILVQSNKKPSVSYPEQTGSIVTFNSQYAGLPLKSHKIAISSQSGVSVINIGSDNKYAGFINYNQLLEQIKLISSASENGIDVTNNNDGSFTLNGTATTTFNLKLLKDNMLIPRKSHKVLIRFNNLPEGVKLFVSGYGVTSGRNKSYFFYETDSTDWYGKFSLTINNGSTFNDFRLWLTCYDLTVMFGESKADEIYSQGELGIEYFNSLFPNDYYPYNSGELSTISAVNGLINSFFTIPIGQSVNEGEYDARTGILEIISSTEQTIQLPPCPIETLQGINNIWADTGDTTVQYIKIGG